MAYNYSVICNFDVAVKKKKKKNGDSYKYSLCDIVTMREAMQVPSTVTSHHWK